MSKKPPKKRSPYASVGKRRSGAGPMKDRREPRGGAHDLFREDLAEWEREERGSAAESRPLATAPSTPSSTSSGPLGVRGILFDLDGVLYNAEEPIEGAAQAVEWVRAQGIPHRFVTNTTSRPRSVLVGKLARFGIEAEDSQIFTPLVAAAGWLQSQPRGAVALFLPPEAQAEFAGLPLVAPEAVSGAAYVVIGDLGEAWDYPTLNRAFRLLHHNPRAVLVALGMTRYWLGPSGVSLDVAPFVVALEHATGRQAVVLGKPAKPFFRGAAASLDLPPKQVLMIGDDIRSDVAGAQAAGLKGALVRGGKFRPADLKGDIHPDAVFDSIAGLPRWWSAK